MPRLPGLPVNNLNNDQRALFETLTGGKRSTGRSLNAFLDADGAMRGPFNAMLHHPAAGTVGAEAGDPAGLWLGLWHGAIAPITFVISLFTDAVNVYEVHNSGNWYDGGFMLGLTISVGGSGANASKYYFSAETIGSVK